MSPEHALFVDSMLVAAKLLVDGSAIEQVKKVDHLESFHIELDRHDVLIADGMPAESYAEWNNRGIFHNAAEFISLYPEDDAPRFYFCATRAEAGSPELARVRARLSASHRKRQREAA